MIFLFCSVYSTCRCPFFFAKLLPGRMVKYRHANRQRTERQLSANQRFGYFINSSVCLALPSSVTTRDSPSMAWPLLSLFRPLLALSPSFRSLLMHEKSVPGKRSRKASKGGKKKQVEHSNIKRYEDKKIEQRTRKAVQYQPFPQLPQERKHQRHEAHLLWHGCLIGALRRLYLQRQQ